LNISFNSENGESTVNAGANNVCAESGNNWASCNAIAGPGRNHFISCNGCTSVENWDAGDPNLCNRDGLV